MHIITKKHMVKRRIICDLPEELIEELEAEAKADLRSRNSYIVKLLTNRNS